MFVVQDAVAKNRGTQENSNGRIFIGFLIMVVNAAAGGLYPLYRFLNAWAENGEIDSAFITSSISKGVSFCLGKEAADSLIGACGCISKAKERVENLQEEAEEARDLASKAKQQHDEAKAVKDQLVQARTVVLEVKQSTEEVKKAAQDLRKASSLQNPAPEDEKIPEVSAEQADAVSANEISRELPATSPQASIVSDMTHENEHGRQKVQRNVKVESAVFLAGKASVGMKNFPDIVAEVVRQRCAEKLDVLINVPVQEKNCVNCTSIGGGRRRSEVEDVSI